MNLNPINILLADDDKDDCLLFNDAIEEIQFPAHVKMVYDGEQLIKYLRENITSLPDVIFLDLNMPRKNGWECLTEIKQNPPFDKLRVIIHSTAYDPLIVENLYANGAYYYIRKPSEFSKLKNVIRKGLYLVANSNQDRPSLNNFILEEDDFSIMI
jgi:CheY-like chemotaxis protein